ncbi:MAG TPA: 2-dehydropantoate 2-reductase [Kofleriaceae bacterium]|nr:2-dehydropantoate 2-reductase [Kofleriaceae bacterium]
MTRVAVLGAGAIGCWIGGRLAADGHDVTLIGRPRVMDELAGGLELSELGGRSWRATPRLATEASAANDAEIVLVTTKSAATADAAKQLHAPDAVVISFQNGVRNPDTLRAVLPNHRVLAGMVAYNIARTAPGHYHRGTTGELMIEASDAGAAFVAACNRAELACEARADIVAVQWGKLVMNLNNAINALSGVPLADQLGVRAFRRCLAAAQREALDVLDAAKLPVARVLALPARWIARILPMPDVLFRAIATRVAGVDPNARSSMADDLATNRPIEVDYLQGEIVALADRVGKRAPINAKLVELVHAAEAGGKRDFTGAELATALKL